MAGQSITFDFLTRGADTTASGFRKVGDNAALASRGAKVLADVIEKLGSKEDRTAGESALLAKALRQTGDAEDRAAAKAVLADAAIRRLDDSMKQANKDSGGLSKTLSGLKLNPGLLGPAIALAPALGTLTGVVAGAAVGLSGAFVAGAGALAAFGAVAKPVLTDAKTAATAVETAQNNYTAAIAGGTKQSVAYKAEQIAIAKAYANLSPAQIALSRQLGAMASAWDDVKAAQTPVVAGALQPWLKSITDLTGKLGPIIAKVSPVIAGLGTQFDALINSSAFKGFRDFVAGTGSQVVGATGGTLIDLVKAFLILLPKFNPLILKATGGIAAFGPAVLTWANSKKTADDITRFMAWFNTNGPVVGGLLKNIGGALKALAPGLTTGGAVELKIISDFFGLVAKLPSSIAKPLAEVAGAALILSKMGVLKVGLQVVGPALKWLTGGLINIGGGVTAGAEIRTAMVSGGAAAAAEIRAAMTGGGAAAGAAGSAGGAAKGAAGGGAVAALGAAAGVTLAGALIGAAIRALGDKLSPVGTFAGSLNKMFQGLGSGMATSLLHSFTFGGLEAWFTAKFGIPVGAAIQATGKFIQNQWATIWSNTIGGTVQDWKRLVSVFDQGRHDISRIWDVLMTDITTTWDIAKEEIRITWDKIKILFLQGVDSILTTMGRLPGPLGAPFRAAHKTVQTEMAGIQQDVGAAMGNVQRDIDRIHGKSVNVLVIGSGTGTINFNETTGVGQMVSGGLKFMAAGGTGPALAVVGEKGPELVSLPPGSRVFSHGQSAAMIPGIPGFAGGGMITNTGGVPWMSGVEAGFARTVEGNFARTVTANMKAAVHAAARVAAAAAAGAAAGAGSGALGGDEGANKALARQMFPWPASMWPSYDYLEMREAGYNRFARNPSSGAYGIPQALPPTKMPFSAQAAGGSHAGAQLFWMYGYINSVYGNPVNAAAHERAQNWYAGGTPSARPGWAWVGERGPELVKFRGGEQVAPVHASRGTGGPPAIFQIEGGGAHGTFDAFLTKWLQEHVRVKGGGSVQKAWGHR